MARPGRINLLLRLKPSSSSTPDTSFYRISPSLTEFTLITPPNNRTPFYFSNIFPSDSSITPICELVGYPMSDQLLDGCNATLIALGAIGSGKTYNLYGEMSRRGLSGGLVQSSIQYLFGKIRSLTAERNITVIVSLFEMYKNKVRDLGIAYNNKGEGIEALLKIYNEQDLAVKDIRGKAYIEDVSLIQVMTAEEIFDIINLGFKMREQAEEISGNIANDATTILSINLTQKDKHGDINSTKSARFNIVDIAGSEHKFVDSGAVENESETELSNLYALKKVLNKVNLVKQGATVNVIPYKISKLTQFLQSGFSGNSTISILTTIDTDPIKYNETGHVLAFVKSITEIDKSIKKNLMQRPDAGALMAHEMAQRLEEEIYELNTMIKKSQLQHEEKLRLFARLVGIDDDLESLVLAKKGTKEFQLAMKYKESFETTKNLNRRNADLEKKNNENKKILDHIKILHQNNKDKQRIELTNLETEIRDLKDLISEYKYKNEEIGQEQTFSNSEGLERMLMHSHLAVEENSATLHNLKLQMQNNTTDLKNLFEMKELGINEVDNAMKKLIYDNEEKQKTRFANLEEQFKYIIGDDEDSHREFFESQMEINTYLRNLDESLNEMKKETAKLLEVANVQDAIIYDIEDGKYNNGIRPVLIPTKHHPPAPSPILFPIAWKLLPNPPISLKKTQSLTKLSRTQQAQTFMKTSFAQSFSSQKEEEPLTTQISFNNTSFGDMDINNALSARFQGLTPLDIKKMGYTIQQSIKNIQSQIESVQAESGNSYKEIEQLEDEFSQISEERNVFKEGYSKEVRSRIDMQDKYYSVPKVDDRFFFLTEAFSRPSTQSKSTRNLPLNNQFSSTSIPNIPFNRNRHTSSANPGPRLSTPYSFQASPRPKTSVRVLRPAFSASGFNFLLPK